MFSRTKIAHLWSLLAITAITVSALPYSQLDVADSDLDFDCEEWDAVDDATSSQIPTFTSASATSSSTALASPYSTPSSSPATFITSVRIAQASSVTPPSQTSAFIAPVNSFIPVTPPSYAFYLQTSSSANPNGLYAAVSAGAGQTISLVADKTLATKFTIDSSGDLVEQSPSQGYVANLKSNTDIQKVAFYPLGTGGNYGKLNCQRQSGSLGCNVNGVSYYAATCGGDGNLYFGKTIPPSCAGVALVPIFP